MAQTGVALWHSNGAVALHVEGHRFNPCCLQLKRIQAASVERALFLRTAASQST